jgi:hypothetical protein
LILEKRRVYPPYLCLKLSKREKRNREEGRAPSKKAV